jgi:1,4-alpha-glucan branching enzyme
MGDSASSGSTDHLPELFHVDQELGTVQKIVDGQAHVQFRIFFPAGFDPQIVSIRVSFSLQSVEETIFTYSDEHALKAKPPGAAGVIWELLSNEQLDPGFYVYKYQVTFTDGSVRQVADPCARYSGRESQSSGFVIGGAQQIEIAQLSERKPLKDLVVYELHAGDFTAQFRGARAPFDAIVDKLDYLKDNVGINAILIMPWTAFVNKDYDWGYSPFQYFAVEYAYANDLIAPSEKISKLKNLISECHRRGIHIIMDGVFNHADQSFPYKQLYLSNANCPYTQEAFGGTFTGLQDLDFANNCTQDFIRDVCLYYISEFKIDGIRFDNTTNFFVPTNTLHGIPELLQQISDYTTRLQIPNFSLTLEHIDPSAASLVNATPATSFWDNGLYSACEQHLLYNNLQPTYLAVLNDTQYVTGPSKTATMYLSNHDHASIAWKAGQSDTTGAYRWYRTQPHVIALLSSPGTPMIPMGQEFAEDYWIPEDDHGSSRRVRSRPLRWNPDDPYAQKLLPLYKTLLDLRAAHPALRSRNFYPPKWEGWMTQLDGNGFGVDVARKLVVFHRWSDDGEELFYIALNFSDADQVVELQFARSGVYADVLGGSGRTINVVGNRAVVTLESNWGHVYFQGV